MDLQFGHKLKQKFPLAPTYVNLNHGSFGCVPWIVKQKQDEYFAMQESRPDVWFRTTYYDLLEESRREMAKLISAEIKDVVLVENVSFAINSVLRSVDLKRGDKVLILSTAYNMVKETLYWLVKSIGIEVVEVPVRFPVINEEQLLQAVQDVLKVTTGIKLAIFSHISSMPSMIEPVAELTAACKQYNNATAVLLDGAHAPGVLDIDINRMNGADYYVGNCHKWLFSCKGTAFLWCKTAVQDCTMLQPAVISSLGKYDYTDRFSYTGTRDYTAFTSLPTALHFIEELGGQRVIYDYCHSLVVTASKRLAAAWGTYLLVPEAMVGVMCNVVLPSNNEAAVTYMQQTLLKNHDVFMITQSITSYDEIVYFTRLSGQIYLDESDFALLESLVPLLLSEWNNIN